MREIPTIYRLVRPRTQETRFLICTNRPGSPWYFLPWNIGKRLGDSVPEPVVYFGDYNLDPEDLQLTNGIQFLVSEKLFSIIKNSGANVEAYNSEIVFPNGKKRTDYYSLNFLDVCPVVNRNRSIFQPDPDFPDSKIYEVEKLVIDKRSIPRSPIFIMAENVSYLLASDKFKTQTEKNGISGVLFDEMEVV